MIKSFLKILGIGLLTLIVIGVLAYLFIDKPLPNGTQGQEAEQLADEMLEALNKSGFDTLSMIRFNYPRGHNYEWNRKENKVRVKWEENDVLIDLNVSPEEYDAIAYQGYKYFINDSFWLIAPFKVRDSGVVRSTVGVEGGRGLLVSYTTGGVTPGDSYLWILDERGFPTAWKLWTSNVPIGGLEFKWGGWVEKEGVWFSTFHPSKLIDIEITGLEVQ